MAWINREVIVLESGQSLSFDNIFPIKILYPLVLMSDSTVYNICCGKFVTMSDGTKTSNVSDIIHAWINGRESNQRKLITYLKIENNIYFVEKTSVYDNIFSSNKMITEINCITINNKFSTYTCIYTENNTIMVKNFLVYTSIDDDCQHIQTNVIGDTLEIYLLKNNNIKIYHFDMTTNLFDTKKIYETDINVHKNLRNYLIGLDGSLYRIDISTDYNQTMIVPIETTYKIYDIVPMNDIPNNMLLSTIDQEILKYDCKNNVIVPLGCN